MKKQTSKVLLTAAKAFVISCFTAVAGVASIYASTGNNIPVWVVIVLVLASVLGSFLYSFYVNKVDVLPTEVPLNEDDSDDKYIVTYDDRETCKFLNQATRPLFGKDYLDDDIAEEWRMKNPKGFLCLKDPNGNICAGLTVLSFRSTCMKCFLNGAISEKDVNQDCLSDFETSLQEKNLYITLIIVLDSKNDHAGKKTIMMLWGLVEFLKKYYNPSNGVTQTIYAMPINTKSKNMLTKFGFTPCMTHTKRKDNHEVYSLELTEANLRKASMRIGDHSSLCCLQLD